MNITSSVLTKTAEETTSNATYIIEYVTVNDVLTRINANVQATQSDSGEKYNAGYITYENGNVFCNLNSQEKASLFFLDFERIVENVKENAGEMQPVENNSDR
jgi:hypothetical protein